jgi:nicotinamide-nucleotide amidase
MSSSARHAERAGVVLARDGLMLAIAESCTGGLVAARVTAVPGSSAWFDRGFVTYSNAAKRQMLGVACALLEAHGAVSEPVVRAMAAGALARSDAQVALAVSGIAGPGGGTQVKPVGTVCIAWQRAGGAGAARTLHFEGDRDAIRAAAADAALGALLAFLEAQGGAAR